MDIEEEKESDSQRKSAEQNKDRESISELTQEKSENKKMFEAMMKQNKLMKKQLDAMTLEMTGIKDVIVDTHLDSDSYSAMT